MEKVKAVLEKMKPERQAVEEAKISFDASLFGQQLQATFKDLFYSNKYSDVDLVLQAGGQKEIIPAHRFILYAWSPKLRKQLEELPSNGEGATIVIEEVRTKEDALNFKFMLEFMYTGSSQQVITPENGMSLLQLCHAYGVDTLKEECGEFLFENSQEHLDVPLLLDLVDKYGVRRLEKRCAEHLAENFVELLEAGSLWALNTSTWAELIKSDEIKVTREEEIFNAILQFADLKGKNNKEKREILEQLLPHIRYVYCSAKFLVEEVEKDEFLSSIPLLKTLLFATFRYRVCPDAPTTLVVSRRKANKNVHLTWDKDQSFTNNIYQLENEGLTAHKVNMPGTIYVMRTKGILSPPGPYFYEISVDAMSGSSELHIGLCIENFAFTTAYLRSQGAYYWERTGDIMQDYGTRVAGSGTPLKVGDKLGFLIDFAASTLEFFRNDTSVHTFRSIPNKLWPVIAARDVGTKLTLVCGKQPPLYRIGGGGSSSSS
ncbi:BTB/POZ domain containing protein [Balamuthia mandrillaris]